MPSCALDGKKGDTLPDSFNFRGGKVVLSNVCVIVSDYFTSSQNPHHEELIASLQVLQTDKDRDVRYFSCQQANSYSDGGIAHAYDTVSGTEWTFHSPALTPPQCCCVNDAGRKIVLLFVCFTVREFYKNSLLG